MSAYNHQRYATPTKTRHNRRSRSPALSHSRRRQRDVCHNYDDVATERNDDSYPMQDNHHFNHRSEQYCGRCQRYMDRCTCYQHKDECSQASSSQQIVYKTLTRKEPWPPLRISGPVTAEDREFRNIEASSVNAFVLTANPEEIFVPSPQYPTLGDALKQLQVERKPLGYTITLKNGTHTLASSINNDLSFLKIQAESSTPHMGLFYGQDLGQGSEFGGLFNEELEVDITGVGPWRLQVDPSGKRISVFGINNQHPDFNSLCPGDVIRFYHRNIDCFTDHCICSTCDNNIFIDDKICLSTDDCVPLAGEGFVVMPRTRVEVVGAQKLLVQGRLEWNGIHVKQPDLKNNSKKCMIKGHFTAGATAGYHQISHTVVSSNIYNVGTFEMYKPNTYANGLFVNTSGSGGKGLYQSVIGSNSSVAFHSGNYSSFEACNVVGSVKGLDLVNGSDVAATFGTFVGNNVGVRVESKSRLSCGGCMFIENTTGLFAFSGSSFHSTAIPGLQNDLFAICFMNNVTGMNVDVNSNGLAETVIVDGNMTDLLLDGDAIMLPTANNVEIGTRLSTYVYNNINPAP